MRNKFLAWLPRYQEERHTENSVPEGGRKGEQIVNPIWKKGRHSGVRDVYYAEREKRHTKGYGIKDFAS